MPHATPGTAARNAHQDKWHHNPSSCTTSRVHLDHIVASACIFQNGQRQSRGKWPHLRHSAQLRRMAPFLRFLTTAPSEFSIMQTGCADWGKQRLRVEEHMIMNIAANGDNVSPMAHGKFPFLARFCSDL